MEPRARERAQGRGPAARRPGDTFGPLALDVGLALGCAALALWIYRRALGGYFTNDDFVYLERARGIVPPQPVPLWRFLSGSGYFRAVLPWFGLDPFPYHLVNWLIHGLNVTLVYTWTRRWGGGPLAAFLAAGLFGASRYHLSTLQQAVTIGELGGLMVALAALLVALGPGVLRRIGSATLFAIALLFKESVVLLPLVLLLPRAAGEPWRPRIARSAPLLVPGAMLMLYLAAHRVRSTTFGGEAYATGWGANMFHNLMTYASWAVDLRTRVPDLAGGFSTSAWQVGLWVALGLALLALASWRSSRAAAAGAAWWLLGLVPVLPLLRHSYLHYCYLPLAGFAMALGAGGEWLARRARGAAAPPPGAKQRRTRPGRLAPAIAWAVAVTAVLAHAGVSGALLDQRFTALRPGSALPLDPFVRRAELARRLTAGFGRAVRGPHFRAVILTPDEGTRLYSIRTGEVVEGDSLSPRYFILPAVIDQGRALRLLFPEVDSVAFVSRWTPAYLDFDLFVTGADGAIEDLGCGLEAHVALASRMLTQRYDQTARQHLETVLAEWPNDARLRFAYCLALARTGDKERGLEQLEEIVRRTPRDTLAAAARALLDRARR